MAGGRYLRDELAWLAFSTPRRLTEALASRLPLGAIRDALPPAVGVGLRRLLYPARIARPRSTPCARRHAAWGDPAALDPARPVRLEGTPRASVLVVTWGNLALTRLCLASLQRAPVATPFEVIVVDNASTDGTPAWLDEAAASGLLPVTVVHNAENRGFAAANNQAAALARGDVLVFLNNDTVVTPGWLDRLVNHLDRDPNLGLVGPVTNACGYEAEVLTPYADLDAMFAFAAAYTAERPGELEALPMLALFCAAMPASLFRAIGGLDEGYGVGMFEDDDLCAELELRGRHAGVARDAFVHHYGAASFATLPRARYLRIWWENHRRFEAKWRRAWRAR